MLITRCSACYTTFRVTEAQLAARDGRVRCGRCQTVFDARSALLDPGRAEQNHVDTALEQKLAAPSAAPEAGQVDSGVDLDTVLAYEHRIEPALAHTVEPTVEGAAIDASIEPSVEPAVERLPQQAPEPAATGSAAADPAIDPLDPRRETSVHTGPAANLPIGAEAVAGSAAPAPQGIRQKEEPDLLDFGPRPRKSRTALWALGSAVLLLALGAQAAFQYRGTIALLLPESKPYLEEFCAEAGCELPLPRRTDLLSIETSDLQGHPNNPGIMVLAATLRNRAPFQQAYPALELTLTDDRDQPLARRVLQPADYLGQNAARADGSAFPGNSEQPVRVFLEASSLKATSYRLYLFHP